MPKPALNEELCARLLEDDVLSWAVTWCTSGMSCLIDRLLQPTIFDH